MPGEEGDCLAGFGVPDSCSLVSGRCHYKPTIWAKCSAIHIVIMAAETGNFLKAVTRIEQSQFRFGSVWALYAAVRIRQCFEREKHAHGGVALARTLLRKGGEKP